MAADSLPITPMPSGSQKTWCSWICFAVRRVIYIVMLAYLGVLVVAMFLENSLIFFPSVYPDGDWQPTNLPIEDVWFQAKDGTKLHGWYVPCKDAKAAVLFCHGNGGNITHRVEVMHALHQQVGVSAFFFDYRGYGSKRRITQ